MKPLLLIIALFAVLGLVLGLIGTIQEPAKGGPILISSAIYLGLFSIAYMIEDKGRKN